MSNISIGSTQTYQTLTPSYSPLGKPAAGLESPENKDQTLPPVEEAGASEKNRNQPGQKTEALAADDERQSKGRKQRQQLTEAEQKEVRALAAVDREVRAHEAAHQAAGGSLAGPASFRFVTGPDGVRYAVSGEVPISMGAGDDARATIRNAEQVKAAALAPARPSAQDRRVAAEATQLISQAQFELALQRVATLQGEGAATDKRDTDSSRAIASFTASADEGAAPGSLLDQRS